MRILYASNLSPFPNDNGGRQRTKLIWEALAQLGEVDFVLHSGFPVAEDVIDELAQNYGLSEYHLSTDPRQTIFMPLLGIYPRLAYWCAQNYASPRAFYAERKGPAAAIRARCESGGYDAVVVRYFRCAARSGLLHYTPLCIDLDDIDWEFFASAARTRSVNAVHRVIFRLQAKRLHRLMVERLRTVDLGWISKREDAHKVGSVPTRFLPNAPDTDDPPAAAPSRGKSRRILFVGSLGWTPNQLGLLHFVEQSLPRILAQHPDVRLQVVGSGGPAEFQQRISAYPGVEYVGRVPEVASFYRACLFSIVPVESGAGSHIKILESLYHGATCVTSRFGHRGYEDVLKSGEALLVADDAAGLAEACNRLIADKALRLRLAERGLAVVKARYTKAAFFQTVAESVGDMARTAPGGVRRKSA